MCTDENKISMRTIFTHITRKKYSSTSHEPADYAIFSTLQKKSIAYAEYEFVPYQLAMEKLRSTVAVSLFCYFVRVIIIIRYDWNPLERCSSVCASSVSAPQHWLQAVRYLSDSAIKHSLLIEAHSIRCCDEVFGSYSLPQHIAAKTHIEHMRKTKNTLHFIKMWQTIWLRRLAFSLRALLPRPWCHDMRKMCSSGNRRAGA